jgi:hypothetical protein
MGKIADKWFGIQPPDPTGAIPNFDSGAHGYAVKSASGRVIKRFKSKVKADAKKKTLEENNPDGSYTVQEVDWDKTMPAHTGEKRPMNKGI